MELANPTSVSSGWTEFSFPVYNKGGAFTLENVMLKTTNYKFPRIHLKIGLCLFSYFQKKIIICSRNYFGISLQLFESLKL